METKGRSDGNISKDNIGLYGDNDVSSVFHVGKRGILQCVQQRLSVKPARNARSFLLVRPRKLH